MEKITFKTFLGEKAMNMATFSDTEKRLGNTALVGFEFEVAVSEESAYYEQGKQDRRETTNLSFFDDISEFEEYFDMSRSTKREIERDYDFWLNERKTEWVEARYEDYIRDDEDDEDAKDRAVDAFYEKLNSGQEFQFRDWLKDEFINNAQFIESYGLEPLYGWYEEPPSRVAAIYIEPFNEEDDEDVSATLVNVADGLMNVIDGNVKVFKERHKSDKDSTSWYVEPDGSIKGGHGVEIVSPPQPLKKALSDMEDVCQWIAGDGLETNESTGLHINVSIPGIVEKLDRVKLALFLGERYSAELFDRIGNTYTRELIPPLIRKIKDSGRIPSSYRDMQQMAQNFLISNKYMTINFDNVHKGYLEFRFAGNAGYERNIDLLKKSVLRCVTAVEIACDPLAEKQEYVKKLVKVFGAAKQEAEVGAYAGPDIPFEMVRLVKQSPQFKQNLQQISKASAIDEKRNILISLMDAAIAITKGLASQPSIKEIVYFKRKAKEFNLTSTVVDEFFGIGHNASDTNVERRAEFKKVYRI